MDQAFIFSCDIGERSNVFTILSLKKIRFIDNITYMCRIATIVAYTGKMNPTLWSSLIYMDKIKLSPVNTIGLPELSPINIVRLFDKQKFIICPCSIKNS